MAAFAEVDKMVHQLEPRFLEDLKRYLSFLLSRQGESSSNGHPVAEKAAPEFLTVIEPEWLPVENSNIQQGNAGEIVDLTKTYYVRLPDESYGAAKALEKFLSEK